MSTNVGPNEPPEWLALSIDAGCRMTVTERWRGAFADGPASTIDPLSDLLRQSGIEVPPAAEKDAMPQDDSALLASTSKTSEHLVYMFGYGWTVDRLTNTGRITFCWNGSVAWKTTQGGGCAGSNIGLGWWWSVDACSYVSNVNGPAYTVTREVRGNYHCNPVSAWPCNIGNPDGYYHWLRDRETGRYDGFSGCGFAFGDNVVVGVGDSVVQGCY